MELKFDSPSFKKRIFGMLGVDFYRLFHTPMLYIFLGIAAMIPALILGTSGDGNALYTNVWNSVAANKPLYTFSDIGEYANMNMVFIFGGIMVSVFIGHDYSSGYVKQLFTTHAKKQDYMMSKSIVCAFAMTLMCITYLIGSVAAGALVGLDFSADVPSLIIAVLSKMIMSLGWASLYTFLNVIFRKYFGLSIALSFLFGTGLPIIAIGAVLKNGAEHVLNIFIYGSSVFACLDSGILTLIVCTVVSLIWAAIYNALGTLVLSKCDVY